MSTVDITIKKKRNAVFARHVLCINMTCHEWDTHAQMSCNLWQTSVTE